MQIVEIRQTLLLFIGCENRDPDLALNRTGGVAGGFHAHIPARLLFLAVIVVGADGYGGVGILFPADCKLKVNRGLAKKRKPHDSCFANKHLNNEELSWGKNTLPKLTEKS
ncbi:hypothetical protein, partial [uncultured Desulfovibrio sp.]|uniref:hypothetical protein n=1 Tax=uncultured Desulfovibrio sp. TaxID=167968 RepID=UPI00260433C0